MVIANAALIPDNNPSATPLLLHLRAVKAARQKQKEAQKAKNAAARIKKATIKKSKEKHPKDAPAAKKEGKPHKPRRSGNREKDRPKDTVAPPQPQLSETPILLKRSPAESSTDAKKPVLVLQRPIQQALAAAVSTNTGINQQDARPPRPNYQFSRGRGRGARTNYQDSSVPNDGENPQKSNYGPAPDNPRRGRGGYRGGGGGRGARNPKG